MELDSLLSLSGFVKGRSLAVRQGRLFSHFVPFLPNPNPTHSIFFSSFTCDTSINNGWAIFFNGVCLTAAHPSGNSPGMMISTDFLLKGLTCVCRTGIGSTRYYRFCCNVIGFAYFIQWPSYVKFYEPRWAFNYTVKSSPVMSEILS